MIICHCMDLQKSVFYISAPYAVANVNWSALLENIILSCDIVIQKMTSIPGGH